jgi:hypothetical protein
MIGRMAKLNVFNGSQISERERNDSEKIYLRRIIKEASDIRSSPSSVFSSEAIASQQRQDVDENFLSANPRYHELTEKYAADLLPMGQSADSATGAISAELVNIVFNNFSFQSGGSLEPLSRKLPLSMTVSKLKGLVKQLFGLEIRLQQLSMRPYKDSVPVILDDDESSLRYFGTIDGAEIFINEAKA